MLSGGTKVTPEWIDSMTHIDYQHHMAFVVTTARDGVEQFVGVGRYVIDAATLSADVALVVADAWQGQGLGRRLLATLLEHARSAGVREAAGGSRHQQGDAPGWPASTITTSDDRAAASAAARLPRSVLTTVRLAVALDPNAATAFCTPCSGVMV